MQNCTDEGLIRDLNNIQQPPQNYVNCTLETYTPTGSFIEENNLTDYTADIWRCLCNVTEAVINETMNSTFPQTGDGYIDRREQDQNILSPQNIAIIIGGTVAFVAIGGYALFKVNKRLHSGEYNLVNTNLTVPNAEAQESHDRQPV